jgi:hypothetical protein
MLKYIDHEKHNACSSYDMSAKWGMMLYSIVITLFLLQYIFGTS